VQHSPIPDSRPRGWIRSVKQSLHFFPHQMRYQTSIGFLEGDCQNTANLLDSGWFAVLQKPEERADGRQADISSLSRVATCDLQMFQEPADQRCVQLL
jgi:hypothetical protein